MWEASWDFEAWQQDICVNFMGEIGLLDAGLYGNWLLRSNRMDGPDGPYNGRENGMAVTGDGSGARLLALEVHQVVGSII